MQQELTGDTDMTQMPDDVLGGEGSGAESVDSDDSGEAGASGFGNEDAMEESLIDAAGEGGEAAAPQRTQSEQQGSAIDEGGRRGRRHPGRWLFALSRGRRHRTALGPGG